MEKSTEEASDPRRLATSGIYNARQLGGYPAAGGRQVKWGVFYRAGDLAEMTHADRLLLEKAGIRTIVDFRNDAERRAAPDGGIATVTKILRLDIDAASMISLSQADAETAGASLMGTLYRALVDQARPQFAAFFRHIADEGSTPVLFHCSAGKDRTGIAAALLLSALGASRETVIADYLLSAPYLEGKYRDLIRATPFLAPLLTVKRPYIEAALNHIDASWGGMARYLQTGLGADTGTLKRLYTEDA